MHRHSGIRLEMDYAISQGLNPGDAAVFRLKIVNESPYRETARFGLRLKDGIDLAFNDIHVKMFEERNEMGPAERACRESLTKRLENMVDRGLLRIHSALSMRRRKRHVRAQRSAGCHHGRRLPCKHSPWSAQSLKTPNSASG